VGEVTAGRSARVIIASTRASAGVYEDRCGPLIVEWLAQHGFSTGQPTLVADGDPVGGALREALADDVDLIITSGGTGISPTDDTPAQTQAVLDFEVPGLADAIRRSGLPKVPTSVLSRGVCGVAGRTLVINLPGSPGGVSDGLGVIAEVLDHALDQIAGKDHSR
jgi:molybdenum cofactor synthesis domain-containing protein